MVIVTLERPEVCLESLARQVPAPSQTIVVDASNDDASADVVRRFAGVRYIKHRNGAGKMTTSRNIGLEEPRRT